MSTPVVWQAPRGTGIDDLEATTLEVFHRLLDAVSQGRAAVVVVREADLLGHGELGDAVLANAVVGLVRALATEGARDGWIVNALAIDEGIDEPARQTWIERLADPRGLSGALLRLGDVHLGRVPV